MITFCPLKAGVILFRYMVDAADHDKLEASRNELHGLLEKPQLAGIPVCIHTWCSFLLNKNTNIGWSFHGAVSCKRSIHNIIDKTD